jgi:hypothetical protein
MPDAGDPRVRHSRISSMLGTGCRILPRMCCRIAFDGVGHRRERRIMGREEGQGRGRFFCSLIST